MRRFDWVITTWFNEFEKNISRSAKAWFQEIESHTAESHRDLLFSPKWKSSHAASKHMRSSFLDSHETSLCEISASTVLLYITRHGRNSEKFTLLSHMNWSVAGAKDSKNQSLSESLGILDLKFCFLKKKNRKNSKFSKYMPGKLSCHLVAHHFFMEPL